MLSLTEFHAVVESGTGIILDARPERNYLEGHVPGAFSLGLENFDVAFAQILPRLRARPGSHIAIYCSGAHCRNGSDLRKKLIDLGYTHVSLFRNGWNEWREAGLPEQKAAPAP